MWILFAKISDSIPGAQEEAILISGAADIAKQADLAKKRAGHATATQDSFTYRIGSRGMATHLRTELGSSFDFESERDKDKPESSEL